MSNRSSDDSKRSGRTHAPAEASASDASSSRPIDSPSAEPLARLVACPRCKAMAAFAPSNPFRPFCSERCRTIDLGAWAEERYAIPAESAPDAELDADSLDGEPADNEGRPLKH